MGDFRGGWHSPFQNCSQFAGGTLCGCAGQWSSRRWSRALPQAPTQSSMSFPWQERGHHEHLWHFKSLPRPVQCLSADWGRTKLFKSTLAKNYFPDTLLAWLCWNKVPLCCGSRGRCGLWHNNIPTNVGAPSDCTSQLQFLCRALLGCPGISLILVSDPTVLIPAAFCSFQWSSFPQHSCNSSPSNYESYWRHRWLDAQQGWILSQEVSTAINYSAFQFYYSKMCHFLSVLRTSSQRTFPESNAQERACKRQQTGSTLC